MRGMGKAMWEKEVSQGFLQGFCQKLTAVLMSWGYELGCGL